MVSVIIPAYNRREFIGETVDSVLAQTYKDLEVIVVDDGSTDGTGDYLKSRYAGESRFRYIWQQNAERSVARNTGILAAEGEYVAFLDSDDLWLPEKLEMQLQLLQSDPEMVMAVSWFEWTDERSHLIRVDQSPSQEDIAGGDFPALNVAQNRIGSPTPVIRRQALTKAGMFCLERRVLCFEDWELWTRVACHGSVGLVPKILARHRIHPGNTEKPLLPENYIAAVANMRKRLDKARWETIQPATLDNYWQRLKLSPPPELSQRIRAMVSGLIVFRSRFISRLLEGSWRETAHFMLGPGLLRRIRKVLHPDLHHPLPRKP